MKTTINNYMEKFRKILLFYILGTALTFWIMALIRLNTILFYDYFGYSHWRDIIKTAIIGGVPIGVAIWAFFTYKFPTSLLNFKFIVTLLKPYFYSYLIGILIALVLIAITQLYKYFFGADYYYATTYNIFGFSVLLGILTAIVFYTIKSIKR
jgi:hypothetical protein